MVRDRRANMALLLALCLTSLVLCASYVPPAELAQEGAAVQPAEAVQPAREPAQEESVPAADEPAAEPERPQNAADVYINGVLRGECLLFDGQSYMTMADFAALTGLESNGGTIGGLTPAAFSLMISRFEPMLTPSNTVPSSRIKNAFMTSSFL